MFRCLVRPDGGYVCVCACVRARGYVQLCHVVDMVVNQLLVISVTIGNAIIS